MIPPQFHSSSPHFFLGLEEDELFVGLEAGGGAFTGAMRGEVIFLFSSGFKESASKEERRGDVETMKEGLLVPRRGVGRGVGRGVIKGLERADRRIFASIWRCGTVGVGLAIPGGCKGEEWKGEECSNGGEECKGEDKGEGSCMSSSSSFGLRLSN